VFCISIWEYLFNGKFPFVDTETVKVERGPNGYGFRAFPPSAGGKSSPTPNSYKLMIITGLGSALTPPNYDLIICREWDIKNGALVTGAQDTYVAKDLESRRIVTTEFYYDNGDNISQTYTYFGPTQADSTYGDNFRLAFDGTNTELQAMEKRYYTMDNMTAQGIPILQALVYVLDTGSPTGVKDPQNNDVTCIEVKPFRAWTRFASQ